MRCILAQNAIVDNISGVYLKHANLWWTRALVLALNVPCIIVSLKVRHCGTGLHYEVNIRLTHYVCICRITMSFLCSF